MTTRRKSLQEVNREAIRAMSERLGIADTLRFVNQFTTGQGNYTDEREALFGHLALDEIVAAIESKRAGSASGQRAPASGQHEAIGPRGGQRPGRTIGKGTPVPPAPPSGPAGKVVDPTRKKK